MGLNNKITDLLGLSPSKNAKKALKGISDAIEKGINETNPEVKRVVSRLIDESKK
ncbi:hypothetical protein [Enterococcus casseliflavus]|uniref:hypothetical protein n=1 Tax=Enterococcus casseliflavus TaxID=37734 RepID=UPI0022E30C87|nr:hypothetical protein [Enterococcus casseliflavus]